MPTPIKCTPCNKGVLQNCDPSAANRGVSCAKNSASLCCSGESPKDESPSVSHHFWPKELKNWPNLFLSATDGPLTLREFISVQSTVIPPQTEHTLMFCKAQLTATWGTLWRWHQSSAIWTLQQKQKAETTPLPPELQQCLKRAKAELLCYGQKWILWGRGWRAF